MAITLLEMMLQAELITPAQCDEALQNRVFFGGKIGTNLIELGFVQEEDLARFLSRKLGVPYVPPQRLLNLPDEVLTLIPRNLALKYQVIPLGLEHRRLHLAMADPADLRAIDDIAFITGHVIKPMITPEIRLNQALAQYYQVKMEDRFWQIIDRMAPPRDLPEPEDAAPADDGPGPPEPTEAGDQEEPHTEEPVEEKPPATGRPASDSGETSSAFAEPAAGPLATDERGEDNDETSAESDLPGAERNASIPETWEIPLAEGELTEPEGVDVVPGSEGRKWPKLDETAADSAESSHFRENEGFSPEAAAPGGTFEDTVQEAMEAPENMPSPPPSGVVEAIEDLDDADIIEEESPKILLEPVTRDPVSRALARAADREEIADILVNHLGKAFGKVALFVVRQTYASGWHAMREGVHVTDFSNLRIPLSRPSVLKSVAQGKSSFVGALPETPLNDRILNALGGNGQRQTLVMPLFIAGRPVLLVYLEGGRVPLESRIDDLQKLLKKTALAFEILIARDKILMT